MNFCPPALPAEGGLWGGKRLVLASARKQNPQIDSLIEKFFARAL